jgi:phosphoribosylanthranilate isomerase
MNYKNKNIGITFTGVDRYTNLEELPFGCEYGILFSLHNITNRYPSLEEIENISKILYEKGHKLSLHVCGSEAKKMLIEKKLDNFIMNFERIQVNGKIKPLKGKIISKMYEYSHEIIFQYNNNNKVLIEEYQNNFENIVFLLDGSGGRGISPEKWENPCKKVKFGYAGGISPENIIIELEKIYLISNLVFWIDMEGKIRDEEDKFSIIKIKEVLNKIEEYK